MSNVPKLRFKEFSGEWEEKKLNKLTKIYDGTHLTPNYVEEGIPFYSVEHITANQFENTKYISKEVFDKENKRVRLETNDILMTKIGDIGTSRLLDWEINASFYVSLALIKQSDKFVSSFVNQQIKSRNFQKQLYSRTLHVAFPKKINLGEIGQCSLLLPINKQEQTKIANFLSSIDTKIEQLAKKETLLQEYKKGVMQKIFSQEIRFKADDGSEFPEWEEIQLKKVLIERKLMATKSEGYEHVSLTTEGVVAKSERYERDFLVGDDSTKKYKVTRLNDICYNPANLKFGVITRNKYSNAIFSPIYVTFEVLNANIMFIEYFVTRLDFINRVRKYEEGTVYERQAVKPEDFLKFSITIPFLPEQTKIANFLSSIDTKIELTTKELNGTKEFKKALLQQMFV